MMTSDPDIEQLRRSVQAQIDAAAQETEEAKRLKADYKIQVWFRHNRKLFGDNTFTLSFWESGKRLHGGGDEKMFVCRRLHNAPQPNRRDSLALKNPDSVGKKGCDHLIPGGIMQAGIVVCPNCNMRHQSEYLVDSILYEADMTRASEIIEGWWRKLGSNADIYVKYAPDDPRTLLQADRYGYEKARARKGLTIYPLDRIITDTAGGASVQGRFRSLLVA